MRTIEVSIGLIEQDGTYLLQRRVGDPSKGAIGLIGAFGGKVEKGESPVEAVCRELSEETTLSPTTEDFKLLGNVEVVSDRDLEPVKIMAHAFRLVIAPSQPVAAREGEIVRFNRKEAEENSEHLTPATRAAFEHYM